MNRVLAAGIVLSLAVCPSFAASPKVEAAIKTFKTVAGDAGKLKIFCEMKKVMDAQGEKEDAAADAKINGYMKQLGAEFETAWNVGGEVEENSPDDEALNKAVEDLAAKCK